jgi:hypothetical protein
MNSLRKTNALNEAQFALHPGLFPIGLVDVIIMNLQCNLNHAVFAEEVRFIAFIPRRRRYFKEEHV